MNWLVLLNPGPLGWVTNPRDTDETRRCNDWLLGLLAAGVQVMVPEIADYEIRRELIRAGRTRGIERLDELANAIGYVTIDTDVMRRAAEFWAQARNQGYTTADDAALNADMILAATAQLLAEGGWSVTVATSNVGHLAHPTADTDFLFRDKSVDAH